MRGARVAHADARATVRDGEPGGEQPHTHCRPAADVHGHGHSLRPGGAHAHGHGPVRARWHAFGTAVALAGGVATSGSVTLTAGSHKITAVYSGDSTYAGVSACLCGRPYRRRLRGGQPRSDVWIPGHGGTRRSSRGHHDLSRRPLSRFAGLFHLAIHGRRPARPHLRVAGHGHSSRCRGLRSVQLHRERGPSARRQDPASVTDDTPGAGARPPLSGRLA